MRPQALSSTPASRLTMCVAAAGVIVLGVLCTFEIWQALNYDVIGWRAGGVARAENPILFWIAFGVSALIAAPMWLAAIFVAMILALRLASTKAN